MAAFALALAFGGFALLIAVPYVLLQIALYPSYKRDGGKKSFIKYLADL